MIRALGVYRDGVRDAAFERLDDGQVLDARAADVVATSLASVRGTVDGDFVWLGLHEPSDEEMRWATTLFDLPPLQVEDAENVRQRAKIEIHDRRMFAVFKVLTYVDETSDVETGQVSVFVGPDYVLSVRLGDIADLGPVRHRIEQEHKELLRCGPMAVLHAILDVVVDGYEDVADEIRIDVEELEEQVFAPTRTEDAAAIYKLKRENLEMRRAVSPLTRTALLFQDGQLPNLQPALKPFFRDLADHILRVADLVDTYDALLSTALEASSARHAVKQNDDMRKISAWVAIAVVPTAIAGIYGMNFEHMPELSWTLGYPGVLLLMAGVCSFLYWRFKKSGWL